MSFRNRLTTFFILMVLVPIVAIGASLYRLLQDTNNGRAGARASGLLTAASSVYAADQAAARDAAKTAASQIARWTPAQIRARLPGAATAAGLVRVVVVRDGRRLADFGSRNALAPGSVSVKGNGHTTQVTASTTTAAQLAAALTGPESGVLISARGRVVASTLPGRVPPRAVKPTTVVAGQRYGTDTDGALVGFDGPVSLSVFSGLSASDSSTRGSELLALAFLGGLALLAFAFALWASRSLTSVIRRFLTAAQRLAGGDFSEPVPVEGRDEFGQLARAFNSMSQQLEERITQLNTERGRLRESIQLAGRTLESNLDADELQSLSLGTAVAGLSGSFGRLSVQEYAGPPSGQEWRQIAREGKLSDAAEQIRTAEQAVLEGKPLGEASGNDVHVLSTRLGPYGPSGAVVAVLTVGRRGEPFHADDRALLQSLAVQATRALDNARLHKEIEQKAITDPLTGLANHGEFQHVLDRELEALRRYRYPVGLILLDIDNFKKFNDTYGHPQGDLVLRSVAEVLQNSSRDADTAARYGGEELALVLPHTDLEGSFTIAERVRREIAALKIPRLDGEGDLSVTASFGVSASMDGDKQQLIRDSDEALYAAKRAGKNRTARPPAVAGRTATA